jgi:hypothetical protein
MVILHEPIQPVILNTDCTLEVSRDGGTTWALFTLEKEADYDSGVDILTTDYLDISEQDPGTSIAYRFTTSNQRNQRLHGAYIQWG